MKVKITTSGGRRYGKVGAVVTVDDQIGNWLCGHAAAVLVSLDSKKSRGGAVVREVPTARPARKPDKESDE